jgi:hypothetical protein
MRYLIISLLLLFTCSGAISQVTFNKHFYFGYPIATLGSVLPTDSCYYATGIIMDSVATNGIGNIFVKFDLNGNEVFNKPLTSPYRYYDTWWGGLISLADGNIITIGLARDSVYRAILIKYNTKGDTLRIKEFLSPYFPNHNFIVPVRIIQQDDNNFAVLSAVAKANADNDFAIAIFDDSLNLLSHKFYGNQYDEIPGNSILQNGKGLLFGGNRDNTNFVDQGFWSRTYLIGTDSTGNTQWEYLSPLSKIQDVARGIAKSPDGGLVVATSRGYEHVINSTSSDIYWNSAYFFKLDENRQLVWELEVTDSIRPTFADGLDRLIPVDNGNAYVAAGRFNVIRSLNPPVGGTFGWLFKLSDAGELLWIRKYQILEKLGHLHRFYDLQQTPDGGFIMAGEVSGSWGNGEPTLQGWLVKVDSFGCLVPGCQWQDTVSVSTSQRVEAIQLLLYPNPADDYLNFFYRLPPGVPAVTFRIFDAGGRVLQEWETRQPEMTCIVPLEGWANGVYFIQAAAEGKVLRTERFVVQR